MSRFAILLSVVALVLNVPALNGLPVDNEIKSNEVIPQQPFPVAVNPVAPKTPEGPTSPVKPAPITPVAPIAPAAPSLPVGTSGLPAVQPPAPVERKEGDQTQTGEQTETGSASKPRCSQMVCGDIPQCPSNANICKVMLRSYSSSEESRAEGQELSSVASGSGSESGYHNMILTKSECLLNDQVLEKEEIRKPNPSPGVVTRSSSTVGISCDGSGNVMSSSSISSGFGNVGLDNMGLDNMGFGNLGSGGLGSWATNIASDIEKSITNSMNRMMSMFSGMHF